jgi:tetratricopeptide (TPR) repeat protein
MKTVRTIFLLTVTVLASGLPARSASRAPDRDLERAREAYLRKDYVRAEKYLRALTVSSPDDQFPHLYLGHSLFYQGKYKESVPEYERAREIGVKIGKMTQDEERLLNDQLGMAYGLSGRLDRSKALFEEAIKKDPAYAMYYFNLACAYAEMDQLDAALSNLKEGFARRAHMLGEEKFPNPRKDDSFKKYLGNEKFEAAMKEMGY